MRIVLTHEQADFDALASLLGAYLLDDSYTAVLPRRLNRNVRAFLTLYGQELPFTDARDVPNKPIEAVTLVDTQSPVTFKGMRPETSVHVVDHHPARPDLPQDWNITSEDIGAATTIFVEAFQERNGRLSVPHATLLLLGIYEDTGSLTYTRTTPRDALAVSYLLAQGANLQIAQDFLNHPLSTDQQSLYEQLRAGAETVTIHGHTVVISSGDAQHVEEELSTLAHKLRDLLDPDALVLLFSTRAGIQLIARATTDYIDVGRLAEHFGGGGHTRAAAALIHGKDLSQVAAELNASLPSFVQPAVSVAAIMSYEPHLLSPDTPVQTAAELMQRYGYEGFPVTQDDHVVGLLTRRAVDRALSHKLKLTTADLMQAGDVTVIPEDSIETLQQRMIDSGWGQIPVIDQESGAIIGIVTRTDLLKTLAPKPLHAGGENLAARLEASLPPARLALLKAVAEEAAALNMAVYIVGGFVRDLILEKPSLDFDLVVEGDAIGLGKALRKKYKGRFTSHKRFGTAKWSLDGQPGHLAEQLEKKFGLDVDPADLP
ncbi:MAG: CBS domain-containing protein, partial [Anaerolineae bacterium]|nr:CBS domain-containing protein [Anaerolineae bacterium]